MGKDVVASSGNTVSVSAEEMGVSEGNTVTVSVGRGVKVSVGVSDEAAVSVMAGVGLLKRVGLAVKVGVGVSVGGLIIPEMTGLETHPRKKQSSMKNDAAVINIPV